jgi:hypothetical protein
MRKRPVTIKAFWAAVESRHMHLDARHVYISMPGTSRLSISTAPDTLGTSPYGCEPPTSIVAHRSPWCSRMTSSDRRSHYDRQFTTQPH